jgi:predicted transposase YbfD/YdcC
VFAFPIEPMEADFPFARSLIVVRSERTVKKDNKSASEKRYYLSSHLPDRYSLPQWSSIIRGHWGGVEIRNHWKRDVGMGEDKSRTRNPKALANLALMRNALLAVLAERLPDKSWPQIREQFQSKPSACLQLSAA